MNTYVHQNAASSKVQNRPQYLDVLELDLHEELSGGCCPLRIWKQSRSTNGLQELNKGSELLLHPKAVSVHTPDKSSPSVLKEDNGQLATQCFTPRFDLCL
jgi:hypothetical protein